MSLDPEGFFSGSKHEAAVSVAPAAPLEILVEAQRRPGSDRVEARAAPIPAATPFGAGDSGLLDLVFDGLWCLLFD